MSLDKIHCISGLIYQVLQPGSGNERPGSDDILQVSCWTQNKTAYLLPTSDDKELPQTVRMNELCPGLAEAFQLMTVGQKIRVWIPPHLTATQSAEAFGQTLVLDLKMFGFTRMKEPPTLPIELTSPREET